MYGLKCLGNPTVLRVINSTYLGCQNVTKRFPNSVKSSRRWSKTGKEGISKAVYVADTGNRYKPEKRVKRWSWGKHKEESNVI